MKVTPGYDTMHRAVKKISGEHGQNKRTARKRRWSCCSPSLPPCPPPAHKTNARRHRTPIKKLEQEPEQVHQPTRTRIPPPGRLRNMSRSESALVARRTGGRHLYASIVTTKRGDFGPEHIPGRQQKRGSNSTGNAERQSNRQHRWRSTDVQRQCRRTRVTRNENSCWIGANYCSSRNNEGS